MRPSIWLELASFVTLLVILTSGVLIWTGCLVACQMRVNQLQTHLAVVASDRQAMLRTYIRQQQERVARVVSRTCLRQLLAERLDHTITDEVLKFRSMRMSVQRIGSVGRSNQLD